jgi:hypothetical protein
MRDVLISLKPYYYYLIGEGIKNVEVRKSYPKAEDWSRNSWFYMSRDEKSFAKIPKEFQEKYRKHFGKVGMRFVCPKISHWWWSSYDGDFNDGGEYNITDEELKVTCLNYSEFEAYGDTKILHGLNITDLVVYDEPRELRDFKPYNRTEDDCKFSHLGFAIPKCKDCRECYVKRPYQSWGYVEATEPRQTAD